MQTIPLAQRMLNWQKEGHEIAVEMIQTVGGAIPRISPPVNGGRTNGGRTANGGKVGLAPELVKTFLTTTPKATRSEIAQYVGQQGVSAAALNNALVRLRKTRVLKVTGKQGRKTFSLLSTPAP